MLKIEELFTQLGTNVSLETRPDGVVMLDTPFRFPDGDHYQIYLEETKTGGVRISDGGNTLMRLSYGNDIDGFLKSIGGIASEEHVEYDGTKGVLYIDTSPELIADAVSKLVQVITKLMEFNASL